MLLLGQLRSLSPHAFRPHSPVTSSRSLARSRTLHHILKTRMSASSSWNRSDYKSALEALNSLQSNATVIAAWKKQARSANTLNELHEEMLHCAGALDINLENLSPKCIHVAGTKGKGSTSAIAESIVRHHGFTTGLFTSPHLVTVRERIKLNGKAISEEQFVRYFWICWDKLEASRTEKWPLMPGWFRFLTLLAFKVFQEESVACAVIEVGMGGRGDSTNILTFPAVCGITLLDYDHTEVLGNTLTAIADQKAGIFKKGVPAVTVVQTEEAMTKLRSCAIATENPLFIAGSAIENFTSLSSATFGNDKALGLSAGFIKTNAVLSIALAELWLAKWHPSRLNSSLAASISLPPLAETTIEVPSYPPHALADATMQGIKGYHWPGRAQIHQMQTSPIRIFLDGAHTSESMKACVQWYSQLCTPSNAAETGRVLLFNCNKPRDPRVLLAPIAEAIADGRISIDFLYFTMSQVAPQYRKDPSNDIAYTANTQTTWQKEMSGMWSEIVADWQRKLNPAQFGSSAADPFELESPLDTPVNHPTPIGEPVVRVWPQVKVVSNVNEAIDDINSWINSIELGPKKVDMLATGSLYLVGALLEYLEYPTDQ